MSAPTLTEFILARIAEDEAHAHACHVRSCMEFVDRRTICTCYLPSQILAECKVKRKMVELFGYAESFDTASRVGWYPATVAIRSLALPYENHPDYRHEWRA